MALLPQPAAGNIKEVSKQNDASLKQNLSEMQSNIIKKQQEGMRQVAGQENWEQAWKDVRKARQSSPDAYRASRQKRASAKHSQ